MIQWWPFCHIFLKAYPKQFLWISSYFKSQKSHHLMETLWKIIDNKKSYRFFKRKSSCYSDITWIKQSEKKLLHYMWIKHKSSIQNLRVVCCVRGSRVKGHVVKFILCRTYLSSASSWFNIRFKKIH